MDTYTKIKVVDTVEKTAKNDSKYLSIKTDVGNFSCWEPTLFWNFQKSGEAELEVLIIEKGGFKNIVGIKGVDYVPAKTGTSRNSREITKAMDRKEATIKNFTEKKENSMAEFAQKRDSAMFASSPKSREELESDYRYWREFFYKEY